MLDNFDIMAAAGAPNRAVVREVSASADDEGYVVVRFVGVNYSALVSGLEVARDRFSIPPSDVEARFTTTLARIDWIDQSDDETGFKIERRTGSAGIFAPIGTVTAGQTHFIDRTIAADTEYFYRVLAVNADGDSEPSSAVRLVTRTAPGTTGAIRLLDGLTPTTLNASDAASDYELGMEFRSSTPGVVTHIRYYKASNETGPHTGRIWTAAGELVASVDFTGGTTSGWQQQALPVPLPVYANDRYVVSVNINTHYVYATASTFNPPRVNGPLTTLGGVGRFNLTAALFPSDTYGENYFRDIVFHNLPPAAVTAFTARRDSPAQATLTWADSATFEDGHLIERSTDGGASWQEVDLAPANATSTIIIGLIDGQGYQLRLTVTSPVGPSSSVTTSLGSLSGLQQWRQLHFLTTAPSGDAVDLADPDGDGFLNLMEYALGTLPLTADAPVGNPVAGTDPAGHLTFAFRRERADLTYIVEGAPDLDDWETIATNPGTVGGVVLVTDTAPVNFPKRFLRLRVISP